MRTRPGVFSFARRSDNALSLRVVHRCAEIGSTHHHNVTVAKLYAEDTIVPVLRVVVDPVGVIERPGEAVVGTTRRAAVLPQIHHIGSPVAVGDVHEPRACRSAGHAIERVAQLKRLAESWAALQTIESLGAAINLGVSFQIRPENRFGRVVIRQRWIRIADAIVERCPVRTICLQRREATIIVDRIVLSRQAKLLHVVGALSSGRGLAHFLHRRQQKRDDDGDDGYDNQQFNERNSRSLSGRGHLDLHLVIAAYRREKQHGTDYSPQSHPIRTSESVGSLNQQEGPHKRAWVGTSPQSNVYTLTRCRSKRL